MRFGTGPNLAATATITANTAAGYATANLFDPVVGRKWRAASNEEWLVFDFGSTKQVAMLGIAIHNMSAGGVIIIQANTADVWTSPAYDSGQLPVYPGVPIVGYPGKTYRYFRVLLQDKTKTYVEATHLFMGDFIEMTEGITYGGAWSPISTRVQTVTRGGSYRQSGGTTNRTLSASIRPSSYSSVEGVLNQIIAAAGRAIFSDPLYGVADRDVSSRAYGPVSIDSVPFANSTTSGGIGITIMDMRRGLFGIVQKFAYPIFAVDILDLKLLRGIGDAGTSIRTTTGTVRDNLGVLQTAAINRHRVNGARNDGTSYFDTDSTGRDVHPKRIINGVPTYDTHPAWAAAAATSVGDTINLSGYWHTAIASSGSAGGTAPTINTTIGGTFTDGGVTWRNDGFYTDIELLVEGPAANIYPLPEAVVSQTFSVGVGDNTLSVYGIGSIAITAGSATATGYGTATEDTDVTINVTVAGTVVCTLTGALDKAQMEAASVSSSFTAGSRTTEQGNLQWLQAYNIDIANGVLVAGVKFGYDKAVLPAGNYGLVSINTFNTSSPYNNNAGFRVSDGTSTATIALPAFMAGDVVHVALRWNAATLMYQIGYLWASKPGQVWTWGSEISFDGTLVSTGTLIQLFIGQFGPVGLRFLHIYDLDLGSSEIETRYP